MTLDSTGIVNAVVSHALTTGRFEKVNTHEPKSAPGNGLTAAVWLERIEPAQAASGLTTTSARVVLTLRIFSNMLAEPQDAIDPDLMAATDALMAAYSADFDLDGLVRNVDLFGAYGEPLSAQAGYVEQDRRHFRLVDINIPLIVNDVWPQSA